MTDSLTLATTAPAPVLLPRRTVAPSYDRVLRYTLYLRAPKVGKNGFVTALDWGLVGFSKADRDPSQRGVRIADPADADAYIAELLRAPHVADDPALPIDDDGLLDFATFSNTLVVFRLFGGMWQGAAPAITTKSRQDQPGYMEAAGYDLRCNGQLGRVDVYGGGSGRRFSALAMEVAEDMPVRCVGVNFHVEFLERRVRQVLPVIIDPDGQNQGRGG